MASGIYHFVKISTFKEILVIVFFTRKVKALGIKMFLVSKIKCYSIEASSILCKWRGYSLEVNGSKQETTTHRYLCSFYCYRNDFNVPLSF